MGKVWESGVVQVVQHAANLPTDMHPLNLLSPALAAATVDEIVYLPVYDASPNSPVQGVVAVLELMVTPRSLDVMVVANLISTTSEIMQQLGIALSNPAAAQQQPDQKIERKSAPSTVGGNSSYDANNQAWAGAASAKALGSGSSGGGMARTQSVLRALGDFH